MISIKDSPEHTLPDIVIQQRVINQRLLQICCNTDRYEIYILPTDISIIYNNHSPVSYELVKDGGIRYQREVEKARNSYFSNIVSKHFGNQ